MTSKSSRPISSNNTTSVDSTSDMLQRSQQQQSQQQNLDGILYGILQSDDFTVSKYLNVALAELDGEDDNIIQMKMTELALQLQLHTQSCHEEIGKIGIELQAILPRCSTDMNRITIGLNALQYDSKQLYSDITNNNNNTTTTSNSSPQKSTSSTLTNDKLNSSFNKNNNEDMDRSSNNNNNRPQYSSMETLSTLHALQANLLRTKEILEAAASWDTTVESIAPLLANAANATSGGGVTALSQAVQLFIQLENGERALRGMPNPEERTETIQKIRYQVSSLLQPQLKVALNHMNSNTKSLQQCVSLYTQLNQIEVLKNEYVRTRPVLNGIHKLWFDYNPSSSIMMGGDDNTQNSSSSSFVEWFPIWLDSVLTLIAEERRQSKTIFGSNKQQLQVIPEIIIRVIAECFRPILPSFKSRLETIYSSSLPTANTARNATPQADASKSPTRNKGKASEGGNNISTTTSTNVLVVPKGSLNDISTIYESMLQFLSLVYEIVTGCWIDLVDSGSIGNISTTTGDKNKSSSSILINDASTLYIELKKVFIQVASPFAPYQKNLAPLEDHYLRGQAQLLDQKMEQLLAALLSTYSMDPTAGWETLQSNTADELMNISNDIIPIAEGSVARFELLSGGCDATASLQVIDRTLATHANELTLVIHKISSRFVSSSNNNNTNIDGDVMNVDEGHVMCALHVLKIAGQYHRSMKLLQHKTSERLQLLSERVLAHIEREEQLEDAIQKVSSSVTSTTSTTKTMTFQLPESLSIVEVDSILTTAILKNDDNAGDNNSCLNELKNLIDHDTSFSNLYPDAKEASSGLALSCQTFVFEVCFALPRHYLSGVSSMTVWKESKPITESWMTTSSYGTLPQSYVTHVGEHMLALVQALEPFATDRNALDMANEIMNPDHIRRVSYQFWYDFIASATGASGTESLVKQLVSGKDLIEYALGTIPIDDENDDSLNKEDEDDEHNDNTDDDASTIFCNKWLDVIGLAVTGRLLERVMRIPSLSSKGCEQLNVDFGYIVNVLSALGISGHPHVLLGHVSEICILDGTITTERINHFDRTNQSADFLRAVEERLSAMRGIQY